MSLPLHGPGKYDDECTAARESAEAVGCVLIVIEGKQGNGVSVQVLDPELLRVLPMLLENVAAGIRAQAKRAADA